MAGQSLEELKAMLKIAQVAAEANETAYNSKIRAFTQVKEKVQGLKRIKTDAIQRRADEERKLLKERYSSKVRTEEMKHESVISRIKSELEVQMKALCRQNHQEKSHNDNRQWLPRRDTSSSRGRQRGKKEKRGK